MRDDELEGLRGSGIELEDRSGPDAADLADLLEPPAQILVESGAPGAGLDPTAGRLVERRVGRRLGVDPARQRAPYLLGRGGDVDEGLRAGQ